MQGLMMDTPLTLTSFFERARRLFPGKEIVTRSGPELRRTNYGDWAVADGAPRFGPREARGAAGQPGRHLRLERRPSPRALLRRALHGRGAPSLEPAPRRRGDCVHREPRRGRGALRRPLAAPRGGEARSPPEVGAAIRGDGRHRTRRRLLVARRRLRGAAPLRHRRLRLASARRERGRGHVLHVRHDGPSQGRRVLAPLDLPAHPGHQPRRLLRVAGERHRDARGADVPRHGLGSSLRLRDAGGEDRDAGPAPPAPRPRRAHAGASGSRSARACPPSGWGCWACSTPSATTSGPSAPSSWAARPCPRRSSRPSRRSTACRSSTPGG